MNFSTLNTGVRNVRNVGKHIFGLGSLSNLKEIIEQRRIQKPENTIFFLDNFFSDKNLLSQLNVVKSEDLVQYINSEEEPTTTLVNDIRDLVLKNSNAYPSLIVAIGGGCTLDVAKAVANLITNPGNAEDYQGWDLVKNPAIYKIGIPTISGTGSETTRTCVMTNPKNGLKLGMNSDYTVYDQLILDPELTSTVPKDQYFWTGMDAYIHCIESLQGSYRNAIGDSYSNQSIKLCREVFLSSDMQSNSNREKLMTASFLGGCAIGSSYVGVVHPFSAALSVVLGTHHCVANCIVMRAMEDFYPIAYNEFWNMVSKQSVKIPVGICKDLTDQQFVQLYNATIIHDKPLTNALGNDYLKILTKERAMNIFKKM